MAATQVRTDRLSLRPVRTADAAELFAIFADPAGWRYDVDRRHRSLDTTREFAERAAARWDSDGLSYWTVRNASTDQVIGIGGVQRHRSGAWNVFYRFALTAQGRGLATELGHAALQAAAAHDPDCPIIAWIAPANAPSRRVAERLALREQGLRIDASDKVARLAYADRTLDDRRYPPLPGVLSASVGTGPVDSGPVD